MFNQNRSIIAANRLLIRKYWNNRDDPQARKLILQLLYEIKCLGGLDAKEAERTLKMLTTEEEIVRTQNHGNIHHSRTYDLQTSAHQIRKLTPQTLKPQISKIQTPKFVVAEKPSVGFSDIGGLEDVKEQVKLEVVYPKQRRDIYELYGRPPGCGILLWGPPGCGKTLIGKAVATDCDSVFIAPTIDQLMSKWVGESEKKVAEIFEYTRNNSDCILFFDELDVLLPRSGPSYIRRVRNCFREQMDGISTRKEGLLILGATNNPWLVDPAMRRPGRFTKQIFIPPPGDTARERIFEIKLEKLIENDMLGEDVSLSVLASKTNGMSGADIEDICKRAIDIPLEEAVKGSQPRKVSNADFTEVIGKKKPSIIPWIVAALNAIKRYKADEFKEDLLELTKIYLDDAGESEDGKQKR